MLATLCIYFDPLTEDVFSDPGFDPAYQVFYSHNRDENELQHLLYTAVNSGQAMAIRYPRGSGVGVPLDTILHKIQIGNWEIMREGNDVAILAVGVTVAPALEAAHELAANGIKAAVVNARFIKPLDVELLTSLASCIPRLVTVEENTLSGGFGSSVARLLHDLSAGEILVKNVGIPDEYVEQGTQAAIRTKYGLDAKGIARQVLSMFTVHKASGRSVGQTKSSQRAS